MERTESSSRWNRLKALMIVAVLIFTMTMSVIVGTRLSDEALAVLAGAAVGVAAAIPTSLLIVTVIRRRDEERSRPLTMPQQAARPQVIVVAPQGSRQAADPWQRISPSMMAPQQRHFTVVGAEATADVGVSGYEHYD